MKPPKYKYLITQFVTPRDRSGNVYSYFAMADAQSGRIIHGVDVHESNLRAAIFELNGGEHKQNYWFSQVTISWKSYVYHTKDITYIGTDAKDIAAVFRKAMKTRKRRA